MISKARRAALHYSPDDIASKDPEVLFERLEGSFRLEQSFSKSLEQVMVARASCYSKGAGHGNFMYDVSELISSSALLLYLQVEFYVDPVWFIIIIL